MALLFCEHFDGYNDTTAYRNAVANVSSLATYENNGGRWGGGALKAASLTAGDVRSLKASPGANMLRCAFHARSTSQSSTVGPRPIIGFRNAAATRFFNVWMISGSMSGTKSIYVSLFTTTNTGNAMVSGYTSEFSNLGDDLFHHFELELAASTTVGSFKLKIDGIEQPRLTIASGATSNTTLDVTTFDRIAIAGANSNSSNAQGGSNSWIDDLIVWDDTGTDFTGALPAPHRLRLIVPTADGSSSQWTPLAGANYEAVDEAQLDADTTYVSETVAAQIDFYKNVALGYTPQSILGLQVESIGKMDTGVHNWRNVLKDSGGTTRNGVTRLADTTYRKTEDFYGQNPATAAAWLKANIEASEWGVEFVS